MCHLKNVWARMKIKKHDRIPVPIGLYPNQQLHGVCIIILQPITPEGIMFLNNTTAGKTKGLWLQELWLTLI
jgi:hypothetical protein